MVLDYMAAVHALVRLLCREVLGITDENFFRPHGQRAPAGPTNAPYGTIQLYASDMESIDVRRFAVDDSDIGDLLPEHITADLLEVAETLDSFTASVTFWRDGAVDSAGRPSWGETAHSRARALIARFWMSENVARATAYGLGYAGASKVRDLSSNVDGGNERRAQVDLYFYVSNAEVAALNAFRSATIDVKVQQPDGHINEVIT